MTRTENAAISYTIAAVLLAATSATLVTFAVAKDDTKAIKSQVRHPDIVAIATEDGGRRDMVYTTSPDGSRDVVIALPDGRYLIQRYYPSGYNVIIKPERRGHDAVADLGKTNES